MLRSRIGSLLAGAALAALPGAVGAQVVLLQMRPQPGDTLDVRMEQVSELVGTRKTARGETHSAVTTMLQVFSHAIVEGAGPTGATVRTVTDSALVTTTDPSAGGGRGRPVHLPVGREVRMRIAPNGSMQLAEGAGDRHDDAELAGLMPAAFPTAPVRVGERWAREMMLPRVLGNGAGGVLHATFHLDSLSRGGALAYVSMEGEMRPQGSPAGARLGPALDGGKVSGLLVLDRKRGWLSESRFSIDARTTVISSAAVGALPMRFHMRVTQRVKTLDRR